jgi:hypothetical protein
MLQNLPGPQYIGIDIFLRRIDVREVMLKNNDLGCRFLRRPAPTSLILHDDIDCYNENSSK